MDRAAHLTTVALGLLLACTPSTPVSEEARVTNVNASGPTAAPSQRQDGLYSGRDVIFTWGTPGPAPDCPVCGSANYLCSSQADWGQGRTFVDPTPAGSRVVGVQVRIYYRDGIAHTDADGGGGGTSCTSDPLTNVTFKLNGVEVGNSGDLSGTCDCSSCNERHTRTWDFNGIPGYVYGGTNTFRMETSATALCIQRVELAIYSELRLLSVTPTSLAFGDESPGSTTASQTVRLQNTGDTELTLIAVNPTGPFVVTSQPQLPMQLGPDQSTAVTVAFRPTACGEAQGTLQVQSTDQVQATRTVSLSGRGITRVSLSPSSYDFGDRRVGTSSAPQTVTVTNGGSAPVTLETLSASGPFTVSGLPPPLTLAAGASTTFSVTFTPTAPGRVSGGITLTSNPCNGTHTLSLQGNGIAPVASLSPSSISFGDQRVGTSSSPTTVTLRNTGTADLNIANFTVTGPFTPVGLPPRTTLSPGEPLTFGVVFTPTRAGVASGSLILQSDAYSGDTSLPLSGNGVTAILTPSVTTLSFGNQRVGTSTRQTVYLQNVGSGPVLLQRASAPAPFTVSDPGLPRTIAPGEPLPFEVTFTPDQPGPVSRTLTWVSDASNTPHLIALEGTGTYASLSATPAALDFGSQRLGTPSPAQTVVLTNRGTAPLQLSGVTFSAPFSVSGLSNSATIEPGGSLSFQVTFTPIVFGTARGSLTLTSNALTPVLTLPLSGTGASATLSATPNALSFGSVAVGTSPLRTVTLTNTGTSTLTVRGVAVTSPFTYSGLDLPKALLPNASTTFQVSFTPIEAGPAAEALTLRSEVEGSTDPMVTVIPLDGTGLAPAVTLSPSSLAFTPQRVLTPSQPRTVVLTNTGTASLVLSSSSTLGPFQVSGLSPNLTLPRGTSVSFQVAFTPQAEGPAPGSLLLFTNAASDPIVLNLQGTGIASSLRLDMAQLAFGDQRVGRPSLPRQVTVFNDGSAPLNLSRITAPAAFIVSGLPLPASISPGGGFRTFEVTFQPTGPGPVNDSLTLTSDALEGPSSLPVSGNGVAPVVRLSPLALTLGDQRVGTTGAGWTATLTNDGTDSLYLASATVSGPFVLQGLALPRTLARGESLPFQVAFSPVAPGRAQGAVTFVNDTNQPAILPLEGTGTVSQLTLEPASLSFGAVAIGDSASLPVHLSNPGTELLHLSTWTLSGPFSITQLPATLNAGATTSFLVTFSPASHGFVGNGALTLYSDAYRTPAVQMPLSGQGVGPRVVLSTDRLVFDPVNVGVSSAPRELNVTNGGETELRVLALSLSGAQPEDFQVPNGVLPLPVQPEATVPLPFVFRPRAVGERSAQATLFTNDPLTPIVGLTLTGPGTSPLLVAVPPAVSFGPVRVGSTSSPQQLTLTNRGSGPLTLSLLTLSGVDSASFSLAPQSPPLTLPLTLPPGGSLPLQLTFSPQTLRTYNTTVAIGSDDPAQPAVSLPVSGTGTSPILSLSRMELDFGAQLVGRTARPRTVVLTNTGNARLTVSRLALSGVQAAQFSLVSSPPLPLLLEPGASQPLEVSFSPSVVAEAAASLQLTSDDPVSPTASLALRGVGVNLVLAVSPTRVDFGTVLAPARSSEQLVTLTNVSNDPVVLGPATLSGSRPEHFTVDFLPRSLAPGESTTAAVTWRTDVAAESSARLDFDLAEPSQARAASVVLQGRAVGRFLQLEPMSVDFGAVNLGQESEPALITLTNQAAVPITVERLLSSNEAFQVDPLGMEGPLPPGQSGTFLVSFRPTEQGSASGEVRVVSRGAGAAELSLSVEGRGEVTHVEGDGYTCASAGGGSMLGLLVLLIFSAPQRVRSFG